MAGLVDYVVDSEEENNSDKTQEEMDLTESKARDASSRTSASNSPSSAKKQETEGKQGRDTKEDSRETRGASSKRKRDKEKHERKRSRERESDRRKRSRSRDRDRERKRQDERRRRKSHSRSRSRSPRRGGGGHRDGDRNRGRTDWKSGVFIIFFSILQTQSVMLNTDLKKKYDADARAFNSQPADSQSSTPALPAFYNPAAVNPSKVVEQIQKRKLLWGNKEKKEVAPTTKVWDAATFSQDQDGKVTAKFKRLMGIKGDSGSGTESSTTSDVTKKQEELFATLDQQYEIARATTHTQRGVGLGFSSGFGFPR